MNNDKLILTEFYYNLFIQNLIQARDKIAPEDFHLLKHKARIAYDNWKNDRRYRDNS